MKLAFIGNSNWDIYTDDNGRLSSIPKPGNDASSSHFGDKHHILKLMRQGYFNDTATDAGLELMEGLHTRIFPDGVKFLSF